jgi:hypothetical protein
MGGEAASKLALLIVKNSDFILHLNFVVVWPSLDERPVEEVTIKGSEYRGPGLPDVLEELFQQSLLIRLVEYRKSTDIVVFPRRILKIWNIFADNLPICDKEAWPIDNIGYHHDFIEFDIWEF